MNRAQRKLLKELLDNYGFVPKEYEGVEWAEKTIKFQNCELEITMNIDNPSFVVEIYSFEVGFNPIEIMRTPATKSDWREIQKLITLLKSYQPELINQ